MKKRGLAILLALCMLLSACGKGEQNATNLAGGNSDSTGTELTGEMPDAEGCIEMLYDVYAKALPDVDEALEPYLPEGGSYFLEYCEWVGDTVYRLVQLRESHGYTDGYCLQRLKAPYEKWECQAVSLGDWIEGVDCGVTKASVSKDGKVQLILHDWIQEPEMSFYWAEWTDEGPQPDSVTKIEGSYMNQNLAYAGKDWYIDSNRRSYMFYNTEYKYYDAEFNTLEYGENEMRGLFYQILETDEKTYVCGSGAMKGFKIWDAESGKEVFSTEEVTMFSGDLVIWNSAEESYLCSTGGSDSIYKFSMKEGTIEQVVSLFREGYSMEWLYGGAIGENGEFSLLTVYDGDLSFMEIKEAQIDVSKQQLELALGYADPFLKKTVVEFNKQSANYQVVLRVPAPEDDWEDFQNRLMAEFSHGEGPDLLGGSMLDIQNQASQGYLKDLTELFKEDRSRIWETAWQSTELDGKVYAVPYACDILTLVSREEFVGERTNWNLDELLQCYQDSSCQILMLDPYWYWDTSRGESVVECLTTYVQSQGGMIDWEKGVSHLNEQKMVDFLELVKNNLYTGFEDQDVLAYAKGEVLIMPKYINSVEAILESEAFCQGQAAYIGFPVGDGDSGSVLLCDMIGVNQACECEEGVNEFLSYLISEEVQKKIAEKAGGKEALFANNNPGFPVDRQAFDIVCKYAKKGNWVDPYVEQIKAIGGFEYLLEAVSEESVEKFRKVFETARPASNTHGIVRSIVMEESAPYFDGSKSAQEVCDAMHNRVQLYLDEIK